tara:strand:- start:1565 stop:2077 length:513 start_codon:yes stop_codon:yes gene_type:complete
MTSILTDEQENSIREQIENTYKEVWATLLHDKVKQNPPDFEWIVRLYKEIKYKLTYFLKQNSPMRNSIEESLDIELFEQMIKNGAFQGPEFYNLVNYIFDTTLKLGSPARDNDVKSLRKEILTALSNKATFAELVPLFFINANTAIDWVHKDLFNVKGNIKKAINNMNKN